MRLDVLALGATLLSCAGATDSAVSELQSEEELSLRSRVGCLPGSDAFAGVSIEQSARVGTVHWARWETTEPLAVQVYTDVGRDSLLQSPLPDLATHSGEALILGVPALTTAASVLVADTDAGRVCSEVLSLAPAAVPVDLPELSLSVVDSERAAGGFTLLSVLVEGASFAAAVDEVGEYVWFMPVSEAAGVPGQTINRVVFSRREPAILFMTWASGVGSDAVIYRVALDGEVLGTVPVPGAHRDFIELPDGSFLAIGWDIRELQTPAGEIVEVVGDRIIEVDPFGESRVIWSAFDTWSPDLSVEMPSGSYPPNPDALDWSHVNGMAYDSDADAIVVSAFGLRSLVKVDRQSGEVLWTLASTGADYSSSTGEVLVRGSHSVEVLAEDRLLIFNRNMDSPYLGDDAELEGLCSEAVELRMDLATGEAERVWSYGSDDCLLVVYYGEAIRLENGHTLVIFSSSGQVSEATPEGDTVWQLNADIGGAFGFGDRVHSLY